MIEVVLVELFDASVIEIVVSSSPAVAGHVIAYVCKVMRPQKSKPSR